MYSLYITPPLPACIMYEVHGVIIGNTQSVIISFLFLFFFHQSSLYPSQLLREFVCARGRPGGLARTCWSAREEGLVVSRVRVCMLARKGWWSREYVFARPPAFPREHTNVVCWDAGNARTRYLCSISL